MSRTLRVCLGVMAAVAAIAAPLAAATYTVTLNSGGTFSTLYKPIDAPWNPQEVVFYDETGNLIGLAKSDIASVESDVEANGYGHVIDDTTIVLGWAPNDKSADAGNRQASQAAPAPTTAGPSPGGSEEPIYDVDNIPPTMQIIPSATPSGPVYAVPATQPATSTPPASGQSPPQ